jgi:GDP-L-fucose synthase
MMGVQMMEVGRQVGIEKFVAIGTICAYPKFTPVPFKEENLWDGYPEETNPRMDLLKRCFSFRLRHIVNSMVSMQYIFCR